MKAFHCPNCGAQISLDDNRDFGFCQYCGTKILIDDYRSTHRVVDEARIHESETDRIIRLRELEIEEKEIERSRESRRKAYIIAIVMAIIGGILAAFQNLLGLLLIMVGGLVALITYTGGSEQKEKRESRQNSREGMIKLSSTAFEYEGKNYKAIEEIYTHLGFKNVSTVNLRDLRLGLSKKNGVVEDVLIDDKVIDCGKWYNPNAEVVITYHDVDK